MIWPLQLRKHGFDKQQLFYRVKWVEAALVNFQMTEANVLHEETNIKTSKKHKKWERK
jgi:hypothetical protein